MGSFGNKEIYRNSRFGSASGTIATSGGKLVHTIQLAENGIQPEYGSIQVISGAAILTAVTIYGTNKPLALAPGLPTDSDAAAKAHWRNIGNLGNIAANNSEIFYLRPGLENRSGGSNLYFTNPNATLAVVITAGAANAAYEIWTHWAV